MPSKTTDDKKAKKGASKKATSKTPTNTAPGKTSKEPNTRPKVELKADDPQVLILQMSPVLWKQGTGKERVDYHKYYVWWQVDKGDYIGEVEAMLVADPQLHAGIQAAGATTGDTVVVLAVQGSKGFDYHVEVKKTIDHERIEKMTELLSQANDQQEQLDRIEQALTDVFNGISETLKNRPPALGANVPTAVATSEATPPFLNGNSSDGNDDVDPDDNPIEPATINRIRKGFTVTGLHPDKHFPAIHAMTGGDYATYGELSAEEGRKVLWMIADVHRKKTTWDAIMDGTWTWQDTRHRASAS